MPFDLHPLLKEISSIVKRSLYESASWCHSRFTNRRKCTNTSLPFSQSSFLPSSLSYRYTHTRMKAPQRNCFPICQKAEHERLKITVDDRYRQTDRRVQEALQPFNLYGKYIYILWMKILPVTLFPFKSGAKRSRKSSTETVVLHLCDLITELMCLYGRWRPCQAGGDEETKV